VTYKTLVTAYGIWTYLQMMWNFCSMKAIFSFVFVVGNCVHAMASEKNHKVS
jgi:hypothetical protein